jgi:hypothetical protein
MWEKTKIGIMAIFRKSFERKRFVKNYLNFT